MYCFVSYVYLSLSLTQYSLLEDDDDDAADVDDDEEEEDEQRERYTFRKTAIIS